MGRSSRPRPARLGEKLLRIRQALELSQESMANRLGDIKGVKHNSISGYELGMREPPLQVLLEYARIANVHLEVLADDNLDLPEKIPSLTIHGGIERTFARRNRSKRQA
jgi:transcriptional regulator with XRE-family HTH domain